MDCFQRGRKFPKLNAAETTERFRDYVVVVTGGCSGIGRASVERFANDGATVYALDIRLQGVEQFGNRVTCIELDVSDAERCKQVISEIAERHNSTINTLVNCAAYFGSKGLTATEDDWRMSFGVNVIGVSNMVQAVEPFMRKGENCSVINLSSISGVRAQVNRWTYSATKGAIVSVTRCMALDLREKEIRVNAVCPSWIWTPEVAKAAGSERSHGEDKWKNYFISERLGEVEEVAAVVVFLASKDASFITGSDVPVCGGYLAIGPEQLGADAKFAGTDY